MPDRAEIARFYPADYWWNARKSGTLKKLESIYRKFALRDHIALQLPEYARPLFLRLRKNNDVTTTFKPKKTNLTEEGFDPSRTTDPIYFSDAQRKAFVRVDPALYKEINAGQARL